MCLGHVLVSRGLTRLLAPLKITFIISRFFHRNNECVLIIQHYQFLTRTSKLQRTKKKKTNSAFIIKSISITKCDDRLIQNYKQILNFSFHFNTVSDNEYQLVQKNYAWDIPPGAYVKHITMSESNYILLNKFIKQYFACCIRMKEFLDKNNKYIH